MNILVAPISWPYGFLTTLRNKFYDWHLFRSVAVDLPVVAIGNVTVGGTGKTPVLIALAEKIMETYPHVGVVSRGYKRTSKGVLEVTLDKDAAKQFGDEPALIKSRLPEALVFVGEKRVRAARAVQAKNDKAIIFADDAIQHRRLKRDLNVLLMDVFDDPKAYRLIPRGRARERLKPALRRSDFIILTKTNLIDPDLLKERMEWLAKLTDKPVLRAEYVLDGFAKGNQTRESLSDKSIAVSAVARPESIDKMLANKAEVVKHQVFPDHHTFTNNEVEELLDEASRLGARWVVCTEKDWVKLKRFQQLAERLWVMKLKVQLEGNVDPLYEKINSLVRAQR